MEAAVPSAPNDVHDVIDELYQSFCFDAGGEADWESMRALFAPGATFVAPIAPASQPEGVDAEAFIASFKNWIATSKEGRTGMHERVLLTRMDQFGSIAQAWVFFEGFTPGQDKAQTRGMDAIQFVLTPAGWRVMSFMSQYESEDVRLPGNVLVRDQRRK